MQRYDFFFRQLVEETDLDNAFNAVENAVNRTLLDVGIVGIVAGFGLAQQASPNLTVQAVGPGVAYDQTGNRIAIPSTQNVDCTVNENGISTAVIGPSNSRWLSIFIEFERSLSDPRIDGSANTIYYNRAESFAIHVASGTESAGTPTRVALRGDQLLLGDIELAYGQTTITTGDLDFTRTQLACVASGTPHTIRDRTLLGMITQLLTIVNEHVRGDEDQHEADAIQYGGGPVWADSTTNPSTTVEEQLDKIIADLSDITGAAKIGLDVLANWADGTTNPALALGPRIATIVSRLAATTSSNSGAAKIGIDQLTGLADGTIIGNGTLRAALDALTTALAGTGGGSGGSRKIGAEALNAWADSTANAAGSVWSQLAGIVDALRGTAGTAKVGGAAMTSGVVSISAGTLLTQLQAIVAVIAGHMAGAASSTDNAITRFDGITGKTIQNSLVTIDDAGNIRIEPATNIIYNGAPTRKTFVPSIVARVLSGTPALTYSATGLSVSIGTNNGEIVFPLGNALPDGAVITAIRLLCQPGTAQSGVAGIRLRVSYRNQGAVFAPGSLTPGTASSATDVYQANNTLLQTIDVTSMSYGVAKSGGFSIQATVRAGVAAGTTPDVIYGLEVTWTDPGPRNY